MPELPEATLRVIQAAEGLGLTIDPIEFPEGTKTSADAAAAVGAELAQIAKSLVFVADDEPVLVLMAGDRRVDTDRLAAALDAGSARRASLDECREATGYSAGGTPAFGHIRPMTVVADRSLLRNDEVWSAAGTPTTVYPIMLDDLVRAANATWVDVAE
jgi:prolyl-tRNA editing enzyme YbaK/EbsC (Cys-tRNA(Pro) deacylase)